MCDDMIRCHFGTLCKCVFINTSNCGCRRFDTQSPTDVRVSKCTSLLDTGTNTASDDKVFKSLFLVKSSTSCCDFVSVIMLETMAVMQYSIDILWHTGRIEVYVKQHASCDKAQLDWHAQCQYLVLMSETISFDHVLAEFIPSRLVFRVLRYPHTHKDTHRHGAHQSARTNRQSEHIAHISAMKCT